MGQRDELAARVLFTAMQQLSRNSGTLDVATLRQKVEEHTKLDAWDRTILPHEKSRWCSALERYSHEYVKARLINKKREQGRWFWSIATKGVDALSGDPMTAFGIARRAYLRWQKGNR